MNVVRSARGEIVDFGLLRIKNEQEQAALTPVGKPSKVLVRNENFIADKQAAARIVAESKEVLTAAMKNEDVPAEPVRKILKKDKSNA